MKSQEFKAIHELGGECLEEFFHERFEFMGIGLRMFLPPSFCLIGSTATQAANGINRQEYGGKKMNPNGVVAGCVRGGVFVFVGAATLSGL